MTPTHVERLATRLLRWKTVLFCAVIVFVILGLVASRQAVATRASIIAAYASVMAGTLVLPALSFVHWFAVPPAAPALSLYRRMPWPGKAFAIVSTALLAAQAVFAARVAYAMLSTLP